MVRPNQEMAREFGKGEILSVEFGDQLMQYLISGLADEGGGERELFSLFHKTYATHGLMFQICV